MPLLAIQPLLLSDERQDTVLPRRIDLAVVNSADAQETTGARPAVPAPSSPFIQYSPLAQLQHSLFEVLFGDPASGNSYGWGYNGESGGWITEKVDFSRFAGKKLYVRFEYVTDAAVNGEGFYLDDVEIPEINYQTDFESDNGGWEAEGFVRIYNRLPQSFILSTISEGDETVVNRYQMNAGESLEIPINIGDEIDNVILVISGTTRYTRTPANYTYSIE